MILELESERKEEDERRGAEVVNCRLARAVAAEGARRRRGRRRRRRAPTADAGTAHERLRVVPCVVPRAIRVCVAPHFCIVFTIVIIVGLTAMPVLVVPRGAVRPRPRALLGRIGAADPAAVTVETKRRDCRVLDGAVDRREVNVVRTAVRERA